MQFNPKHFDPVKVGGIKVDETAEGSENSPVVYQPDPQQPENTYVYTPKTILALNIALATQRPLLISGEPGSGKSTLARNAAAVLGWWYYQHTITSRTQAADLLWTFDALRRLNDANILDQQQLDKQYYVEPGTLWWAFHKDSAAQRGLKALPDAEQDQRASDPGIPPPLQREDKAIVLLDEIDKADPDVPNDLLEPFDQKSFTVRETNDPIKAKREVLLILTTNGERELPPAFMRRCIALTLAPPSEDWFVHIADQKFRLAKDDLHRQVARAVMRLRTAAQDAGLREPSTSEYLDALVTCRTLGLTPHSPVWQDVAQSVVWKHERSLESKDLEEEDDDI